MSFEHTQALAKAIAVNALNYEMADWDIQWRVVDCHSHEDEAPQTFYLMSNNGFDLTLRLSEINPPEESDFDDVTETDWIWAAKFEVICPHSDTEIECCFWDTSVKQLWIAVLADEGWKSA